MGAAAAVPAAVGLGSSVAGGLKGSAQQSQDNNNASAAEQQLSSADTSLIQKYFANTSPEIQALLGKLSNYNGLSQGQISALQTTDLNSGMSAINTARSQTGSEANPNALFQSLLNQSANSALNMGTQLGSQANQSQLEAMGQAGNVLGSQSAMLGGALGGQGNVAQYYNQQSQSIGNPWAGLSGNIANVAALGS